MLLMRDVLPELVQHYRGKPLGDSQQPSASQEILDAALGDYVEYSRRLEALAAAHSRSIAAMEASRRETLHMLQQRLADEEAALREEVEARATATFSENAAALAESAAAAELDVLQAEGNRLVDFWKRKNQYMICETQNLARRREAVEAKLESFRHGQQAQMGKLTRGVAQLSERIGAIRYQAEQYRKLAQALTTKPGGASQHQQQQAPQDLPVADMTDEEKSIAAEEEEGLRRCIDTLATEVEVLQMLVAAETRREGVLRTRIAEYDVSTDSTSTALEHAHHLRTQLVQLREAEGQQTPQCNVFAAEEVEAAAASAKVSADSAAEEAEVERQIREKRVEVIRLLNRSASSGDDNRNVRRVRSLQQAQLLRQQITELECEKLRVLREIDELTKQAKYDTAILSKYR
jgi:hypothetical protein